MLILCCLININWGEKNKTEKVIYEWKFFETLPDRLWCQWNTLELWTSQLYHVWYSNSSHKVNLSRGNRTPSKRDNSLPIKMNFNHVLRPVLIILFSESTLCCQLFRSSEIVWSGVNRHILILHTVKCL